jgi:hypothetical protein
MSDTSDDMAAEAQLYEAHMERKAMNYYTIKREDIGKPSLGIFGRVWLTSGWIGVIQPRDVGKRVYLSGDVLQVENDEQMNQRLDINAEADTRRRENLQKPTRDYPGAEQMMRWQKDYK